MPYGSFRSTRKKAIEIVGALEHFCFTPDVPRSINKTPLLVHNGNNTEDWNVFT
jgi:hypothetical protein